MTDNRLIYHTKKFEELVLTKKDNLQCRIWTKQAVLDTIDKISDPGPKTLKDMRAIQNFELIEVMGIKELRYIDPYNKSSTNRSLRIVPIEDLYDKLSWCWEQVGFGGWKPLHLKIKEQGYYINVEIVKIFLSQSPSHQARLKKQTQKSLVTNPILSDNFGCRGQVDLIDMRTNPDGEYNWILNYQDHFTKWVVLRPLKKKCALEVTSNLMHIFYTLGAPNILQSDNGKEFDNKLLLSSLNKLWPCSKIIHGKPRYPQSQGSVESANKRTESILTSVLVKEQKTQWAEELDKVAYMKNTSLHSACKSSPYKILYGRDPPKGLRDFEIPEALHHTIDTVEELKLVNPELDLECEFNNDQTFADSRSSECSTPSILHDSSLNSPPIYNQDNLEVPLAPNNSEPYDIDMHFDPANLRATIYHLPLSPSCQVCDFSVGGECIHCDTCNSIGHKSCFNKLSPLRGESHLQYFCSQPYCLSTFHRNQTRLTAQRGQKHQADKMLSDTAKSLSVVKPGDNVKVPIPKEDRGKLGQKHILGVVTSTSGNYYSIGTSQGILDRKYTRGEFEHWEGSSYLCVSEIPKTEIKMHTAAKLVSYGSNTSCQCRGNCATKHCPCRLRRFHCNSGCHPKVNGKCINNDISKIHSHCSSPPPKRRRKLIQNSQPDPIFNPFPILQLDHSTNKEFKVDVNSQERITISSQNDVGEQSIKANDSCSQEFSTNYLSDLIDCTNSLSLQFSTLEHHCVDWGGDYKDTKLVNTCSIDNFITLISLHFQELITSLKSLRAILKCDLRDMLADIQARNFNSLRFWLSRKMDIRGKDGVIDFFGSEYAMVNFLINIGLSNLRYESTLKCLSCSKEFTKLENITTFNKFTINCQTTIENKITPKTCKHCKRKNVIVMRLDGKIVNLSPLLILEVGNLYVAEKSIEKSICLLHDNRPLKFQLVGYTMLAGNHFTLKTYIKDNLYYYDGINNPKILLEEKSQLPGFSKLNFIVFMLLS